MSQKLAIVVMLGAFFSLFTPSLASAHVTLDPKTAAPGRQNYYLKVPTEKDIPTTSVRLVVPEGVEVTGVLSQPGWSHLEKKVATTVSPNDEESSSERITEIIWNGGSIKPGEYMQFGFATNYTGQFGDIVWKAYQTYSDGSVVAWDGSNPNEPGPKVTISDTKTDSTAAKPSNQSELIFVFAALLFSVAAFIISLKGKKISV